MFKIISKQKLLLPYSTNYLSMAFDGQQYYFTQGYGEKCIIQLNQGLEFTNNIKTNRYYTCLCFDEKENCFWAASNNSYDKIYKLNGNLYEIDTINLQTNLEKITGICYDKHEESILLATKKRIYSVSKTDAKKGAVLIKQFDEESILGLITFESYIIVSLADGFKNQLLLAELDGNILGKYPIPNGMFIKSVVFINSSDTNIHIHVLASEDKEVACFIEANIEKQPYVETDCSDLKEEYRQEQFKCHSNSKDICNCEEVNCYKDLKNEFNRKKCKYCLRPENDCNECECNHCECCPRIKNECDCNECECCPKIRDECDCNECECCIDLKNKCYCLKCKGRPCFYSNNILESIALVETSIAHILNAEGEKIQKVLAVTCNIKEILDTNKEVNKTIINVTHLEQVLYAKLVAYNESLSICCKCNKKCDCSD